MADEEREMDLGDAVDSQLVITLYAGHSLPAIKCTKAGRMTGQMIMGQEGSGIMRIDVELRRAQLALRASQPRNDTPLIDRVMQTKENTLG